MTDTIHAVTADEVVDRRQLASSSWRRPKFTISPIFSRKFYLGPSPRSTGLLRVTPTLAGAKNGVEAVQRAAAGATVVKL